MDPRILSRIGADLEAFLVDYATTQRFAMVWRDIDDGALDAGEAPTVLGGQRFDMLRNREGAHSDVALAASLYRFFGAIGSRRPTDDVATATRVSRATAARRIRDARAEGLLGEARRGVAGERGTRGRP